MVFKHWGEKDYNFTIVKLLFTEQFLLAGRCLFKHTSKILQVNSLNTFLNQSSNQYIILNTEKSYRLYNDAVSLKVTVELKPWLNLTVGFFTAELMIKQMLSWCSRLQGCSCSVMSFLLPHCTVVTVITDKNRNMLLHVEMPLCHIDGWTGADTRPLWGGVRV